MGKWDREGRGASTRHVNEQVTIVGNWGSVHLSPLCKTFLMAVPSEEQANLGIYIHYLPSDIGGPQCQDPALLSLSLVQAKHKCLQAKTQRCLRWQAVGSTGIMSSICRVPTASATWCHPSKYPLNISCFNLLAPNIFHLDFCNPRYSGVEWCCSCGALYLLDMTLNMLFVCCFLFACLYSPLGIT